MSKVIYVGNVPYNMGEEQLVNMFKSVGQIVRYRLVYNRDTGKPKGYGFFEFPDHNTALSAVRNLNGQDVGGRSLRIDLADSDPFLECKTPVRGEVMDFCETRAQWREREGSAAKGDPSVFLASLPSGIPVPPGSTALDRISQVLATTSPNQILEVVAQMKAFVITRPQQARALLVANPQVGYALFQALLLNKIVDPAILQRMLKAISSTQVAAPVPNPVPNPTPVAAAPIAQTLVALHPGEPQLAGIPSCVIPGLVPNPAIPSLTPFHGAANGPAPAPYYRPPVPPAPAAHITSVVQPQVSFPARLPATATSATVPEQAPTNLDAKELILKVLRLTPEQLNQIPPTEREQLMQLRKTYAHLLNAA